MKTVLKKVKKENAQIIQEELLFFLRDKIDAITSCTNYKSYCDDVVAIDVLLGLLYIFKSKILSPKQTLTISLSLSQVVVLLFCCEWQRNGRGQEKSLVMQSVFTELNQQLIKLI
jgi:hypothetical protein